MQALTSKPRCPGVQGAWAQIRQASIQVTPLRACALCIHTAGEQTEGELICNEPSVRDVLPPRARTCLAARAANGPCGPNARHLDMHAWQTHRSSASNGTSPQP